MSDHTHLSRTHQRGGCSRLSRIAAWVMSLMLLLSMVPVGAFAPTVALAADDVTASTAAGDDTTLSIKAGAAVPVEGHTNTWYFPYLTVESNTDRLIKSITVQFTSAITTTDAINVDASGKFELFAGNKRGNKSVNCASGATAAEWQQYLRDHMTITLSDATTTKSIRMIANFEPVQSLYDYNSLNGHYYETVKASGASWETAFKAAQSKTYMGMQGYLVTITSQKEHDYVYTMIGENCWTGATCLDAYTGPVKNTYKDFYASKGITIPSSTMPAAAYYFWVCGPEAGKLVSWGLNTPTAAPDPSPDPLNNNSPTIYNNWSPNEPNNSSGEQCMHFYSSVSGLWNDFANGNTSCTAYVIEYGGMEGDSDDPSTSGGGGDANVDIVVKVEIDIDPKGKTITTSADNVRVGEPLKVSENVNGDPEVKLHLFGTDGKETGTEPAPVTRTYYQKQGKDWVALDGVPTKVGTYKVESRAPYRYADGTVAAEDYTPGSAEFKILPKVINAAPNSPAPSPDKPSDPSALPGRLWSKTYDGTTAFDSPTSLDLSDLLVESLGDAHLTFDSAAFSSDNAGARELTLHNVRIEGADAANYNLANLKDNGDGTYDLTVPATILPAPLTVSPYYALAPQEGQDLAKVETWRAGKAGLEEAAQSFEIATDQLAAADKDDPQSLFNGVTPAHSAATAGGLKLDLKSPVRGSYQVSTQLSGDNVSAVDGKFLIGNYLVSVAPTTLAIEPKPSTVVVTPGNDPTPVDPDSPEPIKPGDPVIVKPGDDPVGPEDILKKVEDIIGGKPGDNPGDNPGGNPDDDPKPDTPTIPEIPEGVEPKIEIIKGKQEVDEIDPDDPGTYTVVVTYPNPDPDQPEVRVEITYEVEPEPIKTDPETRYFTVTTRLRGAIASDSSISPTATLGEGSSYSVTWTPGLNRYVSEVTIDGKTVEPTGDAVDFEDLDANHVVVVTVATLPSVGGSATRGWYTVTVNRYGTQGMLECSPSQTVEGGEDVNVWWEPVAGFKVSEIVIDGTTALTPEQIESGSYIFDDIAANHVVDIRYKSLNALLDVTSRDYMVSTKVVNGPGAITGGSTVAPGANYSVAWDTVIQPIPDTEDPSYGVWEVSGVTVNGVPSAGASDTSLTLDNINEHKNVVVSMRPVLYNVNIYGYSVNGGAGTVSNHRTLFKGQSYRDVLGTPNEDSRIVRVVVDGTTVYDAPAYDPSKPQPEAPVVPDPVADPELKAAAPTETPTGDDTAAASVTAQAAVEVAQAAENHTAVAEALDLAPQEPQSSELADAADETPAPEAEATVPEATPETVEPTSESATPENASFSAARYEGGASFVAQMARPAGAALFQAADRAGSQTPVFPQETQAAGEINSSTANYSFEGVQHNHRVEVYFAKNSEPYAPKDSDDAKDSTPTVTPKVEGSSGKVEVTNPDPGIDPAPGTPGAPVDPTQPIVVKWENIPDGNVPAKVVVGDPNGPHHEIELTPEDIERGYVVVDPADVPGGVINPAGDTPITLVVEKSSKGNDEEVSVQQQAAPKQEGKMFNIATSVTGGLGQVSSSAEIAEGGTYTVSWKAEPGYHVARVLVDGVELTSLLATDHVTFSYIDGPHTVQVELEADPDPEPEPQPRPASADPAPADPDTPAPNGSRVLITPQPSSGMPATGDTTSWVAPLLSVAAAVTALMALILVRLIRKDA